MKLNRLSASGFKGQTFSHQFKAPVTIFTGLNWTGKSSRLEALGLALLGYAPIDGKPVKTSRGIFDAYASGDVMNVSVEGDGFNVSRTWSLQGKSVTYVGKDGPVVDAATVDPGQYMSLSGPEQTRYLFRIFAGRMNLDPQKVLAELAAELKQAVPPGMPKVEELAREQASQIHPPVSGAQVQEWLESLVEWARQNRKGADQNTKRLRETVRGNVQVTESQTQVDPSAERRYREAEGLLEQAVKLKTTCEANVSRARREWLELNNTLRLLLKPTEIDEFLKDLRQQDPTRVEQISQEFFDASYERQLALSDTKAKADAAYDAAKVALDEASGAGCCPTCKRDFPKKKLSAAKKKELTDAVKAAAGAVEKAALDLIEFANGQHCKRRMLANHHGLRLIAKEAEGQAANRELERATALELEARNKKAEADVAYKALLADRAGKAATQRAEDELVNAENQSMVASLFVDVLENKLTELIEKAVRPLVDAVNDLCSEILPGRVSFSNGELFLNGYNKSLSDSERLLLYAGLCVGLASLSQGLRLCAISRLEAFDYQSRTRLINLVSHLCEAGKLDHAVLVHVAGAPGQLLKDFDPTDVEVVELLSSNSR